MPCGFKGKSVSKILEEIEKRVRYLKELEKIRKKINTEK